MLKYRKTTQPLLPKTHELRPPGKCNMYPAYSLSEGKIEYGFRQLATHLIGHSKIVIDGYAGAVALYF